MGDEERGTVSPIFRRIAREMVPVMLRTSVPICTRAIEFDHVRPLGTGSLFRVATHFFLVTADHVLKEFDGKYKDHLVVVNREYQHGHALSFGIGGDVHALVDASHDVAILKLPNEKLGNFGGLKFLNASDIDCSEPDPMDCYALCGYPVEFGIQTPATPFFYFSGLYDPRGKALQSFDPSVNLLLVMDENQTLTPSGRRTRFPKDLNGVSGCPVWRITRRGFRANWTPPEARVVGVETSVYNLGNLKAVKATSWALVLQLIRDRYPELRPSLNLVVH